MKKSIFSLAVATVIGLASTAASAAAFKIDNGVDFGSNGSTSTTAIRELGYTGTLATSIYLGPIVPGTKVIDTNIKSVMDSYGFTTGSHASVAGPTITNDFVYPSDPDNLNINALNNSPAVVDKNGFDSGETFPYGTSIGGSKTWGLTYAYMITGTVGTTSITFDGGYFDIFYQDGTSKIQVARLLVETSQTQGVNLAIYGDFTFDFDGNGLDDDASAFAKAFWVDVATGSTYYDLWKTNPTDSSLHWVLDTNVNPPIPTADQLWNSGSALIRQSTLDGSIAFSVPEPGSVALLGLGLAGLGLTQRRRKMAAAK